jgi:hypothetical protein
MFASLPTQMAAAINSQLASQLELWVSLNDKMLEGVEKFVNLNMNASAASQQLLSAEKPPEPCWVSVSHVGPLSYGYQVADVAWCWYAELAKMARARVGQTNRKMAELFEDRARNALAGAGRMGSIAMQIPGQSSAESAKTITREQK